MARYAADHKAQTRSRLIEAAGRRLKSDGIDGSGIATLVADAGLTNGAFYGHFHSKDDLVATVLAQQLTDQATRITTMPEEPDSVEDFLAAYLSPAHRDDHAGGCPSAALLDEIGRRDDGTRQAYTDGARAIIEAIATRLDAADPAAAEDRAIGIYTLAVGALQLARAVSEPELSDRVLQAAYISAVRLAHG